jgi:hypothetical protein
MDHVMDTVIRNLRKISVYVVPTLPRTSPQFVTRQPHNNKPIVVFVM